MFAEENGLKGDPRLQAISQAIRVVPHFPKHGFSFSLCLINFKLFYFILFIYFLLQSFLHSLSPRLLLLPVFIFLLEAFSCFVAAV